jgi:protein subunit release factor B
VPAYPVSSQTAQALEARMAARGLREEDLDEQFIRSGGHGGQNVNKVSTCVVLVHRPSGLSVRCQQERTQGLNRFWARRILCDKLEEKVLGEKSARRQEAEKIRRQKRKRSKRSKLRMLEGKRRRSETKQNRGGVSW